MILFANQAFHRNQQKKMARKLAFFFQEHLMVGTSQKLSQPQARYTGNRVSCSQDFLEVSTGRTFDGYFSRLRRLPSTNRQAALLSAPEEPPVDELQGPRMGIAL